MASRRQTWFAALLCSLVTACVRLDASHCANLDGDATCAEREAAVPFCSMCTAKNDGCTADTVAPDCTPAQGTDSSTGVTSIASSIGDDDNGDDDPSLTSDPVSAGEASVGDATTAALTATTSSSSSDDGSTGVVESTSESSEGASSDASSETGPECGNGIREGDEQCDGDDLNGETCASLPQTKGTGTLGCDQFCTFNTTPCDTCTPALGGCTTDDDCCSESCGVVVDGLCAG